MLALFSPEIKSLSDQTECEVRVVAFQCRSLADRVFRSMMRVQDSSNHMANSVDGAKTFLKVAAPTIYAFASVFQRLHRRKADR